MLQPLAFVSLQTEELLLIIQYMWTGHHGIHELSPLEDLAKVGIAEENNFLTMDFMRRMIIIDFKKKIQPDDYLITFML